MKTIHGAIILLLVSLYTVFAGPEEDRLKQYVDEAAQDPIRKVGDQVINLTPRIAWVNEVLKKPEKVTSEMPMPEWEYMHGKVLQVINNEGVLLEKYTLDDVFHKSVHHLVFIRNWGSSLADGCNVGLYAKFDGRYQYTSTGGGTSTIFAYDYGKIPTFEERVEAKRIQIERAQKSAEQAKVIALSRKTQADSKALQANLDAANKGNPYGLFRMGERYRDGEGVEKNEAKAREYFEKAAAEGHEQSAAALKKLTAAK